jgi:fructoselysine 6-kinase
VTQVELRDRDRIFGDYDEGVFASFKLAGADLDFICREHVAIHTATWGRTQGYLHTFSLRGLLVSFDFADKREPEQAAAILPDIDYAFLSYSQDDAYIRGYLRAVQSQGPRVAVATLGEHGSLAFDGTHFHRREALRVQVVDTLGAGDAYIAGYVHGILLGEGVEECMVRGSENASRIITHFGAW